MLADNPVVAAMSRNDQRSGRGGVAAGAASHPAMAYRRRSHSSTTAMLASSARPARYTSSAHRRHGSRPTAMGTGWWPPTEGIFNYSDAQFCGSTGDSLSTRRSWAWPRGPAQRPDHRWHERVVAPSLDTRFSAPANHAPPSRTAEVWSITERRPMTVRITPHGQSPGVTRDVLVIRSGSGRGPRSWCSGIASLPVHRHESQQDAAYEGEQRHKTGQYKARGPVNPRDHQGDRSPARRQLNTAGIRQRGSTVRRRPDGD